MRAFRKAVELGYSHVETDVVATSDGVAVVFHDKTLDRVTDSRGNVGKMTWQQVSKARIRSTDIDGGDPPVRLEELLEELPETRFNIDPKTFAAVVPLVAAIKRADALDRVCVGAFSDRRIELVRQALGEHLCVGAGPRGIGRLMSASVSGIRRYQPRFHVAQVPVSFKGLSIVTPKFLRTAHELGVPVHVWTINDANEMHRLLDMGVDGIMTDQPETLKNVMISRGCWNS